MKSIGMATLSTMVFLFMPSLVQANSPKWNASIGVNVGNTHRPNYPQQPPHYSQHRPNYPSQGYPNHGYPPQYGYPPNRPFPPSGHVHSHGGVSLNYQAPSYTTVNHQTYTWVNGDPNVAQIKSSTKIVITNWRELGLPAPPSGMHWIYEDGRYILEPN